MHVVCAAQSRRDWLLEFFRTCYREYFVDRGTTIYMYASSLCEVGILNYSITNNGSPYSTGWPFSARTAFIIPLLSDSISLRSFIASMMQSVSPSFTVC